MAVFEELDAVFVHIPKTGGVSISKALFDSGTVGGHRPAQTYRLIYGAERYAQMFTFGFVREPLDRLASAFAYLKACLLYTSPSPRDRTRSRMPSSA